MFDDFLRDWYARHDQPFEAFDRPTDYDEYVDGKPRLDGVRSFLASRGIDLPKGSPDDPPEAETVHGLGTRKNELVLELIRDAGRRAVSRGRSRFVGAGARRGPAPRGRLGEHELPGGAASPPASSDLFEVRDRRRRRRARGARAASRRPTRSSPAAQALGVEPRRGRGVRGRARRRRGGPRGRLRLGRRRRPQRPGRGAAAPRRRRRRRTTSPSCWSSDDRPGRLRGRAVGGPRARARTLDLLGADASRSSRCPTATSACAATSTRASPPARPGTYLNGFFEARPLPYAEAGYGYPEEGQTLINVTNGKLIRLLVDDEPFDVRYGQLRPPRARARPARRRAAPRGASGARPPGRRVRVRSTRLVSFVQRAVAAIAYEVEPLDEPRAHRRAVRARRQRAGARARPTTRGRPPRCARRWSASTTATTTSRRRSATGRARAACAWRPAWTTSSTGRTGRSTDGRERARPRARDGQPPSWQPGQTLRVVKLLAYGWSSQRSLPALRDQVDAALAAARADRLGRAASPASASTSTTSGTAPTSRSTATPRCSRRCASRSSRSLQAGARAEQRAIPAKGLTGRGYDGHTFWDMETYTLPVLTYTAPDAARDALRWRHSTLDLARERAHASSGWRARPSRGARSAARSARATGRPAPPPSTSTPTSPTPSAATSPRPGTRRSSAGPGLELLVETARLWRSLGHHDAEGGFRIDGVTGPDEYTALVDNNVFTNLMAARNLRAAADARRAPPASARPSSASTRRRSPAGATPPTRWSSPTTTSSASRRSPRASRATAAGTSSATPDERVPAAAALPVLPALLAARSSSRPTSSSRCTPAATASTPSRRRATSTTTSAITVRDSSLSASIQAIVAAEVGHLDLAYDYFRETAFIDLRDLACNTTRRPPPRRRWRARGSSRSPASAACATTATRSRFAPRLPRAARAAALPAAVPRPAAAGRRSSRTTRAYELLDGEPLELLHHGERFTLGQGAPDTRPLPAAARARPGPSRRRGASRRGATRRPRLPRHGEGRAAAGGRCWRRGCATCSAAPGSRRRRRPPWPDTLVDASLRGVDSHGVARVPDLRGAPARRAA